MNLSVFRGLVLLGVIGALLFASYFVPWEQVLAGFDWMTEEMHRFGVAGSLVLMLLAALTAFPAELVAMANGATFGLWTGVVVTWVTAMIGSSVGYCIGRLLGPRVVRRLVGEKRYDAVQEYSSGDAGGMSLFLIRLIPLIPFFLVNYAAGLVGMRYSTFFVATGIGIIPVVIVSTRLGTSIADRSWELTAILSGVLVVLGIAVWLIKRRVEQSKSTAQD